MNEDQIREDYTLIRPKAERLKLALLHEVDQLFSAKNVSLGVPLEGRVKSWTSLEEKLERKSVLLKSASELDDLIGIRAILLFRSDLKIATAAIAETFKVLSIEDTAMRLEDSQFGYQSQHMIIQLPPQWKQIPSFGELTDLRAEIQVRTVAQHIWAAASHKLQYKQEQSVPPPIRRTIYRISALLETVDLELDRVLDERRSYAEAAPAASTSQPLNVDLLASLIAETLPERNKSLNEDYSDLLSDLTELGVKNADQLRSILEANKKAILAEDADRVKQELTAQLEGKLVTPTDPERLDRGVYYTQTGLVRNALRFHFGNDEINKFFIEKADGKPKGLDETPRHVKGGARPKR